MSHRVNISLPAISAFSGAGGLDLGLASAGGGQIEFRSWIELDPDSRATLQANHQLLGGEGPIYEDVRKVSPRAILEESGLTPGETFLVAGGPPCQAFSTAGLRESMHDHRGKVVSNYLEMIRAIQPRFFVFENVRGLLSVALKHRNYRERIRAEQRGEAPDDPRERLGSVFGDLVLPSFKRLGYEVIYGLLNSADYGTPQVRWRLVILGSRDKEFGAGRFRKETGQILTPLHMMPPTHHRKPPYQPLRPWRTLRDSIEHLADTVPSPDRVFTYSAARKAIWSRIPAGKNWTYVRDNPDLFPDGFLEKIMGGALQSGGGKMGYWRRLSWDRPAPTLPTQPQHLATGLCHPEHNRPLSVDEYASLQDFPAEYTFLGNKQSLYKQIGNAVPVNLGRALGETLLANVSESTDVVERTVRLLRRADAAA